MTREEKLKAIYDEMANKKLGFGCGVEIDWEIGKVVDSDKDWNRLSILRGDWWVTEDEPSYKFTTIWHPVLIGDVIQYLQDTYQWHPDGRWGIEFEPDLYSEEAFYADVNSLCVFWESKRERVDVQSDECIDYVYSLIRGEC